jgi:hypothetical protein
MIINFYDDRKKKFTILLKTENPPSKFNRGEIVNLFLTIMRKNRSLDVNTRLKHNCLMLWW